MDLNLSNGWHLHEHEVEDILKQLSTQHAFKKVVKQYIDAKAFDEDDIYEFFEHWSESELARIKRNVFDDIRHNIKKKHEDEFRDAALQELKAEKYEEVDQRLSLLMQLPVETLEGLVTLAKQLSKVAS